MDLELTEEQTQLRDELRRFLTARLPVGSLPGRVDHPGSVDRNLWAELGETGVFSVTLPESAGGLGLGRAEAVIVFEELGRAAVPGPLVQTFLAASLMPGAATGELVIGAVLDEDSLMVEHLEALDGLLVFDAEGVRLTERPAGSVSSRPLDPLTPVHRVAVLGSGRRLGDQAAAATMRQDADLLVAALLVGLGDGAVAMATEYSKNRAQFGRVIGSFQAIKHLLVDSYVWVDVARAAVHAAAVELDELAAPVGAPDSRYDGHTCSVASARVVASSAAARATATAIQVHGGMGYTWELEAHLYLKRVAVLDTTLGSPDASLEHRADELAFEAATT